MLDAAEEVFQQAEIEDGLGDRILGAGLNLVFKAADFFVQIGEAGIGSNSDYESGSGFTSYKRENTPEFVEDSILSLLPAKAGYLWIGTEGGGLLKFSGKTFRSYATNAGLTNGFIRALYQDKSGTLWAGTDHGLFRFSGDYFQRIDGHGGMSFVSVRTIYEDRDGRVWVGGNGLYELRGASLAPQPLGGEMADSIVSAIRQMDDGSYWLATEGGLRQWRPGNRVTTPVRGAPPHGGPTVGLVTDRDGGLWAGMTSAGLLRYRPGGFEVVRSPSQLPGNNVLSLFVDRAGNLWLSTEDGLVRLTTPLARAITLKEGLDNDNVAVIYQDRDSTLLLADITGRMYRLSGATLSQMTLPSPFQKTEARTFYRDRSGALWIGTARDGLLRVENGNIQHYTTRNGLRSDIIRAICEDSHGNIWIGTSSGLSRWDGQQFRGYYLEDGLVYASVHVIFPDHAGDLWVGTDGGLSIIHNDEIISSSVTDSLRNERIRAIYEDARGTVWLGTRGGGLIRVRQGKVHRFSTAEGLPDNRVFQILDDDAGNLWLGGPRGLCHIHRSELDAVADGLSDSMNVLLYDASDIVGTNEMSGTCQPAGCRTSNGILWFATIHGAIGIDPARLRRSARLNVLIEGAYVDERPVSLEHDQIRIPPGTRKLEIDYTAINLTSPEQMIFSFKMEGFDTAWTNAHARRSAYYTNLTPGNYRFRLNVEDGVESRNYAKAGLQVKWMPHYYQTPWFYAMTALALVIAAWSGFKFYSHQTQFRYSLVLGERTRLARELHDTLIQGCVGVSTLLEAASSLRHVSASSAADLLDRAREEIRLHA